jgi:hypothetical protein
MITPIHERWVINFKKSPAKEVKGNRGNHDYAIDPRKDDILILAAKWFEAWLMKVDLRSW